MFTNQLLSIWRLVTSNLLKAVLLGILSIIIPLGVVNGELIKAENSINDVIFNDDFELTLNPQEQTWLKAHPVIRLGIDRDFPPFGSITADNEYVGFTADFMRLIEHRLNIKFDIAKDKSWHETINLARNGQLDMIAALVNTRERQQFLVFSEPYVNNPTIIINDGLKNGYIGSIDNLNNKKIAIEKGSFAESNLRKEYPDIQLMPVKNTEMALSLVASGEADAYIGNAVTASFLIKKLGLSNLYFSGETPYTSNHSIGIVKPNKTLAGIINKTLASISLNDRNQLADYWFGMRIQPHIRLQTAVIFVVASLLILLFFIAWVVSLNKSKNRLKYSKDLIKKQAELDPLTALGNRRKFYRVLKKEITRNDKIQANYFALIFLDLDKFKEINDTLGHSIGDLLLMEVSQRIKKCVDELGDVFRLGGDEFTIIVKDTIDKNRINLISEKIKKSLNKPFHIKGHEIHITTSMGITLFPQDATTIDELVINGDQAMYSSKEKGRNCFSYFDLDMRQALNRRNDILLELRSAVDNQDFSLFYQPIVDLKTNKICKAEALIRWDHAERGFISPDEFISIAEEAGLINEIGEWVFKEAVKQTVLISKTLDEDFQMSINTSPLQYRENGMNVSEWIDYLASFGLEGDRVVLEITEGLLMEQDDSVRSNLFELKDYNIEVAIDDFGTGYSSLSYLKRFDINYLKIDQSFVRNLANNSEDMALCQAIIMMAHKLDCKVIAEGIETELQMKLLIEAGCDYGQGYYFSKPLKGTDLNHLIVQWNQKGNQELAKSAIKVSHKTSSHHDNDDTMLSTIAKNKAFIAQKDHILS